jgi:hypothetical protein
MGEGVEIFVAAKVSRGNASLARARRAGQRAAMRLTLRATLYRIAHVRWVDLPRRAIARLRLPSADIQGGGQGWNAVLRFNGDLDRVTLLPGKPGQLKLAFKVELLRAAQVDGGDEVEFTLEPDTASRDPELPAEMQKIFRARPELAERWRAHSVAQRRQVVRYVLQAKTLETQVERSWIFLERLAETGRLRGEEKN